MPEVNNTVVQKFLYHLIQEHANERTLNWLTSQQERLQQSDAGRMFYLAFGMAPRFTEKSLLTLTEEQQYVATQVKKGFQPNGWPLSQVVRTYLLLLLPADRGASSVATLERLLETAEVDEQVAVYAALPLLAHAEALVPLAVNGLRTNITRVFDAIALHNPFPADYLNEAAWNQMILKAVFMGRPLYQVYRADERTNPALARMLVDFAHERWAADRSVTPELWRFVAPYTDASQRADWERVIASENSWESAAGRLACSQSKSSELQSLRSGDTHSSFTWQQIGEAHFEKMSE